MNWKLFNPATPVMIQGITGREGARMTKWLIESGINVVGGVTPGKSGQVIEGKPVFNSVIELRQRFPSVEVSSIVVPPTRALGAAQEAITAGIKYLHLLTEQIPVHDVMRMKELSRANSVSILGPSSVGYLQFPRFRVGYLGGQSPFRIVKEGSAAVISTSGGMANELMMALSRNDIGIRLTFALGGDRIVGTTLEEAIAWSESLSEVALLAVFIEPGSTLIKPLINRSLVFKKPAVIFLAGVALDDLPRGLPYGHTGTILGEGEMPVVEVRKKLRGVGIPCVSTMSEFVNSCKQYV